MAGNVKRFISIRSLKKDVTSNEPTISDNIRNWRVLVIYFLSDQPRKVKWEVFKDKGFSFYYLTNQRNSNNVHNSKYRIHLGGIRTLISWTRSQEHGGNEDTNEAPKFGEIMLAGAYFC